jgi:hypothetical protein
MDDEMLEQLSLDVDNEIMKWLTTFEVHPLNLTAIILARLTWLAKQANIEQDYLKLLESPKDIISKTEQESKQVH